MITRQERKQNDAKARSLVEQMTLEEKIHLMSGNLSFLWLAVHTQILSDGYNHIPYPAGGCERLGVPPLQFCDGPRGVLPDRSTCFPVTMARGASFDVALEQKVGDIIGNALWKRISTTRPISAIHPIFSPRLPFHFDFNKSGAGR